MTEWRQYFGSETYQKTCPDLPIHPSMVEEGRRLAREGKSDQAVAWFSKLNVIDPSLKLDPQLEVRKVSAEPLLADSWALAHSGKFDEALRKFRDAKVINPDLPIETESQLKRIVAEHLINQAIALIGADKRDEAIAKLREARVMNPILEFEPEVEVQRLAKLAGQNSATNQAIALINQASTFIKQDNVEQAAQSYQSAKVLTSEFPLGLLSTNASGLAEALNELCWAGSLRGHSKAVLDVCEQAVQLAPGDGGIRDSRGLARAITGNFTGAVEDFEAFVSWAKATGSYERGGKLREDWIASLAAGKNPIDEATLAALRDE